MGCVYICLDGVGGNLSILDACGDVEVPERRSTRAEEI